MLLVPHNRHSVNRSLVSLPHEVNDETMDPFDRLYQPVLREIEKRSLITDQFLDKDVYRIYVATFWVNTVTDPNEAGIEEYELELLHDYLNERIPEVLGRGATIKDCFKFVASRDGEEAMDRLRVRGMHRDLLLFFCSMILNPDGHERWREAQRKKR